jgi:hypothetical protein
MSIKSRIGRIEKSTGRQTARTLQDFTGGRIEIPPAEWMDFLRAVYGDDVCVIEHGEHPAGESYNSKNTLVILEAE